MLQLEGVNAGYDAIQVLYDISFDLNQGEVLAIAGRNGMGKTTLVKTIAGLLPVSSGSLMFQGQNLAPLPSHKRANLGLGLVPEGRRIFAPLSVEENLLVAERKAAAGLQPWTLNRLYDQFPRLKDRKTQVAGTLSGGEQQMLAIARALITQPKLLLLDEATEGLAPQIRNEIWQALKALKQTGLAVILIDSRLQEMLPVADKALILEKGNVVWAGEPATLQADAQLQQKHLGV